MRDRRGGGSGGGGSSREDKVAPAGKPPLSPNETDSDGDYRCKDRHEDRPEDRREHGEGAQQQQQVSNGGKTKQRSGLTRQGSKLWRIMRWNRGEAETEAEEDPAADRT